MGSRTIGSIAKNIREICYLVEREIAGFSEVDAALWARFNSVRHAHTIGAILDYASTYKKGHLRILNASGLGAGHQDFSIVPFLINNTKLSFQWTVFESPNSPFLDNELFRRFLRELPIRMILSDFSKSAELYGEEIEAYDIAVFTEIAEHLDHSTLLRALISIRKRLQSDGILIITTPNLVSLINRIRIMCGNGDGPYFGDGTGNLEKGVYGHIVNYDINRLRRLLPDTGYRIDKVYTFTPGYGPVEKFAHKYFILRLIGLISTLFKNAHERIFVVAHKADHSIEIPFRV